MVSTRTKLILKPFLKYLQFTNVVVHRPAAAEGVAGTVKVHIESLAGAGLPLVSRALPLSLRAKGRSLGSDLVVGAVGQVAAQSIPLDDGHGEPGVLAPVTEPLLHYHHVLLLVVCPDIKGQDPEDRGDRTF
jgi:hypothetical protein